MARARRFPSGSVCKPCWELKYCPYGPLVELFPSPGGERSSAEIEADYSSILKEFTSGGLRTEGDVWDAVLRLHFHQPGNYEAMRDYAPEDVGCKILRAHLPGVLHPKRRHGDKRGPKRR
jgi:hypothetical protein